MGSHGPTRKEIGGRLDTIETVVGQLIQRLIESDDRSAPSTRTEEIILDVEVEGVRYLAVRCGPRAPDRPQPESADAPGASLSPREVEVARMVAKGYANKTIASVLEISSWTVSSHLRRIYTKLGVTSRAAMVARLLDDSGKAEPTEVGSLSTVRPGAERQLPSEPPRASRQGGQLLGVDHARTQRLALGGARGR